MLERAEEQEKPAEERVERVNNWYLYVKVFSKLSIGVGVMIGGVGCLLGGVGMLNIAFKFHTWSEICEFQLERYAGRYTKALDYIAENTYRLKNNFGLDQLISYLTILNK